MLKFATVAVLALAAVPALAESFDGPFIGVQGGWQQDRTKPSTIDNRIAGPTSDNNSAFTYGAQLGYDRKITPQIVLGGEVSLTDQTKNTDVSDALRNNYRLNFGRTVNATARVGYLVTPDTLVYARGGYSNARFDLRDTIGSGAQNRDGYTVGAGVERAITSSVSARLEYDYSDYGKKGFRDVAYDVGADSVRGGYRRNAVTAGLNYHF